MLKRERSRGVFGACEFVQLKREALGGDVCSSLMTAPSGMEGVIEGVEERRLWDMGESDTPGPSMGRTGELDAIDERRSCVVERCRRLARGSM
jgi:hypothetical protein